MTNLPADEKKSSLISRSKGLIDSAVSGFKGRDLNALIDEFTQEMTVVAEGLSEEVSFIRQELSCLSAEQTINQEASREGISDLILRIKEVEKRLDTQARLIDKKDKKRGTLSSVLSQLTLIAAIMAGAWVITAILGLIRR